MEVGSREKLAESLLLYAVTDRHWLGDRTLYDVVRESLDGGVTFLQLREKDLDNEHFYEEAVKLQAMAKEYNVPFVVNDNVDIAVKMNADGVHVGQHDMEAGDVRALIGPDKILGVSAQTVEQALLAEKRGADYLGVGAVFPTGSKDDADDVSYDTLKAICEAVSIPVVAIGGITPIAQFLALIDERLSGRSQEHGGSLFFQDDILSQIISRPKRPFVFAVLFDAALVVVCHEK